MIKKNKLMLWISLGAVLLSLVVHILESVFHLFPKHLATMTMEHTHSGHYSYMLNTLLFIPVVLLIFCVYLYARKQKDHPFLPLITAVLWTFSIISIIASLW
ncbi:hypothetical protein [Paenibacillus macquariensis]|uniref:Methyl-accepting chemotaxis protein n=1 Tax=Paenibacillus macquariensis TaxID=948756 RepID=A0ABY1K4B7_9BACL|nr:hypothetical protein [Paenibacillus macquariensis]MEC0088990.1 hypothetical protein [Paenibacillus macquariensis]OAB31870.1 hypothetical protein PMSM_18740 [Paenibacillus macquariensis subsp. macquariensis]SIR24068.1 methyl-accepting chemotaxis protein [Paenibacillus macquariensis]